jgi:hypothetical protein
MAQQIANGMAFMETKGWIHMDLAARNCTSAHFLSALFRYPFHVSAFPLSLPRQRFPAFW